MKILHINGLGYFGGAENMAYLIAKEQMKAGNDVTIAYMIRKSIYGKRAEKEGIKTIEFGMRSGFDILHFKKYIRFIKREKFNIIHDHNGPPLVRLSKLFSRKSMFIQHIHGTKFGNIRWEKRSVLLWKRLTSCLVDHWVANSHHIKRIAVIKERIPLSRISVIYNGIDVENFKPCKSRNEVRKELGLLESEFVIGTVGKLTRSKGIDKVLALAKEIDAKFVIVGDGELRKELLCLRDTMNLRDKVIFTGGREDVANVLSAFDIFLLTSRWEAFGISLVEAMAIGVPIVAFAVDGVPEVVNPVRKFGNGFKPFPNNSLFSFNHGLKDIAFSNGVNQECGILVSINNIEKMKTAINYLKENKSIMLDMKECGIRRVKERFNISKIAKEIGVLYLKIRKINCIYPVEFLA